MSHKDRLRSGAARWLAIAALGGAATLSATVSAQPAQATPSADAAAAAEARFFEGQRLYAAGEHEAALTEIRASYALVPSPNSRLYIARCLRELGRIAEAYDEYAQVILEAADRAGEAKGKYAPTQKAASEERASLKARVGSVAIALPPDVASATVRIGDAPVSPARLGQPVTVVAGAVTVRAEAPGRKPFDWTGQVAPGESQRVEVSLPAVDVAPVATTTPSDGAAAAKRELPLRPLAFVSAGIGVVGMALWGILGVAASSRHDELEQTCGGSRCGPEHQDSVDAGRTESTVSTAGLVIGIAGLAGGVVLWIAGAPDQSPTPAAASRAGASVRVGLRPGFLSVEGAF